MEWQPRPRNYALEIKERNVELEEVSSHPLQGVKVTVVEPKSKKSSDVVILDPLSAALDGSDPLSQFAAEIGTTSRKGKIYSEKLKTADEGSFLEMDSSFEPWTSKRTGILSRYTTSEKLSIVTALLSSSEKKEVASKMAPSTVTDKVRTRLEQLDDLEDGSVQEMLNLSQQEYIHRIEEFNSSLITAWNQDQRVKTLKIAIQCAKLLADVSVIQFYPSKFVLITDILDTFGHLVFDRILDKALSSQTKIVSIENINPDEVPDAAKETCRNWFFKIASIRELIPRFYVEAAILKCYSYLKKGEYSQALTRLASMSRGIGDPLVSTYARCYLARVGVTIAPRIKDHLMPCFDDFLTIYPQIQLDSVQNTLALQNMEISRYLALYSPALEWLLQCIAHRADDSVLATILERCKLDCNRALLLNSILSTFHSQYICNRAMEFAHLIRDCEDTGLSKHLLYRSLGVCVATGDTPEDQQLALLNETWRVVTKLKNPSEYVVCAEVWIEFVLKYFGRREINTLLGDIIKHMMPDRAYEDHYPQLQTVVAKILERQKDFAELFALDKFLPFIDMFQKEAIKVEVCRGIMECYSLRQSDIKTNDPVIINALMCICRTMHDSVNALSLDDEVRAIGSLINAFIATVSFGRDFEQQLGFYVDCRGAFNYIDPVLMFLVHLVNGLAAQTNRIIGSGGHSRKSAAFVRACAAYSFITIPSLNGIFHRLNLYVSSGQVALVNLCLSQADAFFKSAISLIPEMPKFLEMDGKIRPTEPMLVEFINNFISTLIVAPDSPDHGVLYLIRGLLNILQAYSWDSHLDSKPFIYANVLVALSSMAQESLPYHIDRVDSNDALYGCDLKFLAELSRIRSTILNEIIQHVDSMKEVVARRAALSFSLFDLLVGHADRDSFPFLIKLWNFATKTPSVTVDEAAVARTIGYIKSESKRPEKRELAGLLNLMSR